MPTRISDKRVVGMWVHGFSAKTLGVWRDEAWGSIKIAWGNYAAGDVGSSGEALHVLHYHAYGSIRAKRLVAPECRPDKRGNERSGFWMPGKFRTTVVRMLIRVMNKNRIYSKILPFMREAS